MRRPGGSLRIYGPGESLESDTFTCCHCQRVVLVPAKASPSDSGGWCWRCSKLICPACAASGECSPFERRLELAESRSRFLQVVGLG